MNKKLGMKAYIAITVMALLYSVTYSIPYIKSIFYDGMLEFTGVSNAKLGILMTIYGLGEVITPGIGGVIAEKYDYKKIIAFFSMVTGTACILMAMVPSFGMTLVVWGILVFSTLFMIWGTWFKAIRLLAPDNMQGRMNGLFYGIGGLGYVVVNTVSLYAYNLFAEAGVVAGMKAVFITFGILSYVLGIATFFMLKSAGTYDDIEVDEDVKTGSIFSELKVVAKQRGVWYFGGALFCMYSTNIAIQYFTPYFTNVLGTAVVFSGFLAIIRSYGMRAIGAPLGGVLADKIGSIAKVIIVTTLGSLILILAVIMMPLQFKTVAILTAIMLLVSLFNNLGCGIQYAIVSETGIKKSQTAAAVGLGSMIGFSPDVFQHVLFGSFLDNYGNAGYTYIFIYGAVTAALGVLIMWHMVGYMKKKKMEEELTMNEAV